MMKSGQSKSFFIFKMVDLDSPNFRWPEIDKYWDGANFNKNV